MKAKEKKKAIEDCDVCFSIVCRQCRWTPDVKELEQIQQGKLIACPQCGWQPSQQGGGK